MKKKSDDELKHLKNNLLKLHQELRNEMKQKWDRVIPFDELLFDRWEKAKFINAKKSSVYHNSYIVGDVKIGKNTWIGPMTFLDGSGSPLKIGDFCSVSIGAQISTHNSVKWALSRGKSEKETGPTSIGSSCYIGPYAVINKGVKIGNRCVIGALSYVNSDVKSNSIVAGIPAKVIGKVIIHKNKVTLSYFKDDVTK